MIYQSFVKVWIVTLQLTPPQCLQQRVLPPAPARCPQCLQRRVLPPAPTSHPLCLLQRVKLSGPISHLRLTRLASREGLNKLYHSIECRCWFNSVVDFLWSNDVFVNKNVRFVLCHSLVLSYVVMI